MRPFPTHSRLIHAAATIVGAFLTLAAASPVNAQEARPKAADSKPLARFVASQDLLAYAEFEGFEAHDRAWRQSATFRLLNETPLGALLADLAAQAIDKARAGDKDAVGKATGAEVVAFLAQLFQRGVAVGVHGTPPPQTRILLAFRGGARPEARAMIERLAVALSGANKTRATIRKEARTILLLGEGDRQQALWDEQGDAVLCDAVRLDTVLATLDGRAPSALTHSIRVALAQPEAGFEPVGTAFLDLSVLSALPPEAATLGIDGLKRIDGRWGFQDEALKAVVRLVAPRPRRGLLGLFDQPTFDTTTLPPLPPRATAFTVASIAPGASFDRVAALMKQDADGANRLAAIEEASRNALGLDLRRDVLAHLGPKLAFYDQPGTALQGGGGGAVSIPFLDLTIALQIDDGPAVGKALDALLPVVNAQLKAARPAGAPEFRKVEGPRLAYTLTFPPGMLPPGPLSNLDPTVLVGPDRLVIAARRAAAEDALKAPGPWQPTGAFEALVRQLPSGLVYLNVSDPRETLPNLIVGLPALVQQLNPMLAQGRAGAGPPLHIDPAQVPTADALRRHLFPASAALAVDEQAVTLVTRDAFPSFVSPTTTPVLIALLLPAVQSAREAARRSQCSNNLRQIGLALHNYNFANDRFPRVAITDQDGRPLLSWRVAILPYIEQQALYNKFKLDESWDSPHNRALLQSMPAVYACPSTPRPDPSLTTYRAFDGDGTLMERRRGVTLAEITDGTANTLAVVETREAVPWTKPEELPFVFDPANPAPLLCGAGSFHAGGFNALFADGSVRFLKATINRNLFQSLITRAGGEVINANAF